MGISSLAYIVNLLRRADMPTPDTSFPAYVPPKVKRSINPKNNHRPRPNRQTVRGNKRKAKRRARARR